MNSQQDERASEECLLTVEELAFLAGTSARLIERLVYFEVICPDCAEPEPAFKPETLDLIRKAVRMREHLGIAWSSIGFVLELLERIEALESALEEATLGRAKK